MAIFFIPYFKKGKGKGKGKGRGEVMRRQRTAECTRARDKKGLQWHGEATEDWVAHSGGIEANGAKDQTNASTEGAAFEGFPGRSGGSELINWGGGLPVHG